MSKIAVCKRLQTTTNVYKRK